MSSNENGHVILFRVNSPYESAPAHLSHNSARRPRDAILSP